MEEIDVRSFNQIDQEFQKQFVLLSKIYLNYKK